MTPSPGDKLGPYEITAAIGKGGMGEVFRARDTRLGRDVAIKVSAQQFGERFEREARAISSLNHPNICTLFDVGPNYLVMELVEGLTLAERIRDGAIPLDESLQIARQIGHALEAAHEAGIVHRDLKPGNVILKDDGSVKVLDFGLAKVGPRVASSSDGDNPDASPTISLAATQAGVILGTAAYMAPEQARGKPVDKRADIWAFGVVLFEMVTGKRLFAGEDLTDTLARVVRDEADVSGAPVQLQPLLRKCLEKDPRKRLRDISGVDLLLAHGQTESQLRAAPADAPHGAARAAKRSWLSPAVAAMAILGAAALGVGWWRATRTPDWPLVRANLDLPGYIGGESNLALSRDGTRIVYVTRGEDGKTRLATRVLAEGEAKTLAGTEGAAWPFFSPDGQWIGFGADGQLKKVLALGGAPLKLADAPAFLGGSWTDDGSIVATVDVSLEMRRIPEAGGAAETLVPPWAGGGPFPQVLPGGKLVIFGGQDSQGPAVKLLALETKQITTLVPGASLPQYVPTDGTSGGASGHLVYRNGNTLLAAPFDPRAGALSGPAIPVLGDVAGLVGLSSAGDVLYPIGASAGNRWPLQWLRPDGTTEPLLEAEARYSEPRVSPDGSLLAVKVDGDRATEAQLLVYDWRNDRTLALSAKGQMTGPAVWTPDSRYLIWATPPTNGTRRFLWRRADGSGDTHTLVEGPQYLNPDAISPDGKHLAMLVFGGNQTRLDLSVAPLDLSKPDGMTLGKAEPLVRLPGTEARPRFSPDGRWVAYFSDESGTYEVYVQRFPGGGGHRKVSEGGGTFPKWSSNGRQLMYARPVSNRIMVVDYQGSGEAFVASKPRPWSPTPIRIGVEDFWWLDAKGERAVVAPAQAGPENAGPPKVAYLLHFFDELRRRAPAGK